MTRCGTGGTVAAGVLPVICAQNGVASERLALRRFRQVYAMYVWLPATHLEPGTVHARGAPLAGMLGVGRYPSGTDATIERIGADLADFLNGEVALLGREHGVPTPVNQALQRLANQAARARRPRAS